MAPLKKVTSKLTLLFSNSVEGTWTTSTTSPNAQTFGSIENWCTKDVTYMGFLFQGKTTFNANITNWDVSSVTNMHAMFGGANAFNQDISGWNVSSVTNMRDMFNQAYAFDQDISPWNVSKVTDMWGMFYRATSFNEDISQWSVSKVTTMVNMFYGAEQFNQNLCAWKDKNFPYQSAGEIFSLSGCTYKTNPVQETGIGPFCAVQDCCQIATNLVSGVRNRTIQVYVLSGSKYAYLLKVSLLLEIPSRIRWSLNSTVFVGSLRSITIARYVQVDQILV
jgi:surface protein